jgi:hypothetical protein
MDMNIRRLEAQAVATPPSGTMAHFLWRATLKRLPVLTG